MEHTVAPNLFAFNFTLYRSVSFNKENNKHIRTWIVIEIEIVEQIEYWFYDWH